MLTKLFYRDLSERLNLSPDEGEKWVVNLIRETRMGADAKIDLEKVRPRSYLFFPLPDLASIRTLSKSTGQHSPCTNPSSRKRADSLFAPKRSVLRSRDLGRPRNKHSSNNNSRRTLLKAR